MDQSNQTQLLDLISDNTNKENVFSIEKNDFIYDIKSHIEKCLTKKEKIFVSEYYFNNKKQIEIAKMYGVSPQAVNNTLKRAIKKLRTYYFKIYCYLTMM